MVYVTEKVWHNGYRCCCEQTYDSTEMHDTVEEALKGFPIKPLSQMDGTGYVEFKVTDGATGDLVAWSLTSWPSGRDYRYKWTRHQGHHPDIGDFDHVYNGEGTREPVQGQSWGDILAEINRHRKQAAVDKAEQEVVAAQARLQAAKEAVG